LKILEFKRQGIEKINNFFPAFKNLINGKRFPFWYGYISGQNGRVLIEEALKLLFFKATKTWRGKNTFNVVDISLDFITMNKWGDFDRKAFKIKYNRIIFKNIDKIVLKSVGFWYY
jgi:hypothetical protein